VIFKSDQKTKVDKILGKYVDENISWKKAEEISRNNLADDPKSVYDRFNLSVALYYLENYEGSVLEFEKVEPKLPFRMLWYQIEPILSYYELGDYKEVFKISQSILDNHNRAFSELYHIRGKIYKKQNNNLLAIKEFENALKYNKYYILEPDELSLIKNK
jgi:tetratricopeptide (TPR) repeat protein